MTIKDSLPVDSLLTRAFSSIDNSSLTLFRIGWGWILTIWSWDYLVTGRVTNLYVTPVFHFTYQYFEWVKPLPGNGMYYLFISFILLGLAIAIGFFYRFASLLFAIGFTYFFLLEATNYQNHYYLILLISWLNVCLPLHHNLSWDARRNPSLASQTTPRWVLWAVQFHIALPYVFGGLAKFVPDWLLGEPLRTTLLSKASAPLIGSFLAQPFAGVLFSWAGIALDLFIVPLLLYRKTRIIAYMCGLAFHLSNSVLFNIHIFPWFMIVATTIFFEPDWPRRLLGIAAIKPPDTEVRSWKSLSFLPKAAITLSIAYMTFHVVWPLRYLTYEGDSSWTEQGHFFSWRMMLRGKTGGVRYFVTDPVAGKTFIPDLRTRIGEDQASKFSRNPEWILQLAHFLAADYEKSQGRKPEVRALVLLSLNGRKPTLLIDPQVDLLQHQRGERVRPWVLPNNEPLRQTAWDLPLMEWEQHLELPELTFLEKSPIANIPRNVNNSAPITSQPILNQVPIRP